MAIKEDEYVEWVSEDGNYHCRYNFRAINNTTELEYRERVGVGEITGAFTKEILEKLKKVIEG